MISAAATVSAAIREITFPCAGMTCSFVPGITGGRKVEGAVGGDGIDGLRDDPILKRSFIQVADIIHDYIAPGLAQSFDIAGESRGTVIGRGKVETRAGSEIMNDLEHGGAFAST